jgi:CheY-like chemotaxis protein
MREVPAIALTAHARAEDAARVVEAGFTVHLAKPVRPSALCGTIVRLLPPALGWREATAMAVALGTLLLVPDPLGFLVASGLL